MIRYKTLLLACATLLLVLCESCEYFDEDDGADEPQDIVITGTIVNGANEPIERANINYTIEGTVLSNSNKNTASDANGMFAIAVRAFASISVELRITHPDHASLDFSTELTASEDLEFEMEPVLLLSASEESLNLGPNTPTGTFVLSNDRSTATEYTIESTAAFLSVDADRGTLASGEGIEIMVSLDRSGLALGDYNEELVIRDEFGNSLEVAVAFRVVSPDELKWVDEDGDGFIDIRTIDDLYRLSLEHLRDTFDNVLGFELVNDLDFEDGTSYREDTLRNYLTTGQGWLPIGASDKAMFDVDFKGNGFMIDHLFIDRAANNVGLFGFTAPGRTIEGVSLQNVDVNGEITVGALIGINRATVRDCNVQGQVTNTGSNAGLLIGYHVMGLVSNCYSEGATVSEGNDVGGLIGVLGRLSSDEWEVQYCYSTATVRGNARVGGLIGSTYWGSGEIKYCYALGNILATGQDVGGLLGELDYGTLSSCYARGDVTSNSFYVGGLIGENSRTISTSYSTGEVFGSSNVGGLVGRVIGASSVNARNYWDVESSDLSTSAGMATGLTTSQLQGQTSNAGVYLTWSADDWDFGTSTQYPALGNMPGGTTNQR